MNGIQMSTPEAYDSLVVSPTDHLEGAVAAPGDKVASVHLSLAAVVGQAETTISNVQLCGDVVTIYERLRMLGLADIDASGGQARITPKNRADVDLSILSDTRSNICLVALLALQGTTVSFKGTAGCSFTTRAVDRHFALMDAFGLKVVHDGDLYRITRDKPTESVNFDCSTENGIPSVGVTCHALMASLAYDREVILTNTALEAAPAALLTYIRQSTTRDIEVEGRTVRLKSVDKMVHRPCEIALMPDITAVATYIGAIAAAGSGLATIKGVGLEDMPATLLETYQRSGIEITPDEPNAIRVSLERDSLTMPPDITCEAWPGFPTDIAPILSASVAGVNGTLQIREGIYDKRSAHVHGLNDMGYELETTGNTVVVHGQAPRNLDEVTVEAPDIRSGAALVIGALGSSARRVRITNYRQIYRGYATLIENLCSLGAQIERM